MRRRDKSSRRGSLLLHSHHSSEFMFKAHSMNGCLQLWQGNWKLQGSNSLDLVKIGAKLEVTSQNEWILLQHIIGLGSRKLVTAFEWTLFRESYGRHHCKTRWTLLRDSLDWKGELKGFWELVYELPEWECTSWDNLATTKLIQL